MPTSKDYEARIAALETNMERLLGMELIRNHFAHERPWEAGAFEAARLEEARIVAAREELERTLIADAVVWIEASVPANARLLHTDPNSGFTYAKWHEDQTEHGRVVRREERLGAPPHGGRILSRAPAWTARLERTPELAVLVGAGTIVVRELPRDEAIDLERSARLGREP